jgi:hypothetical protein
MTCGRERRWHDGRPASRKPGSKSGTSMPTVYEDRGARISMLATSKHSRDRIRLSRPPRRFHTFSPRATSSSFSPCRVKRGSCLIRSAIKARGGFSRDLR